MERNILISCNSGKKEVMAVKPVNVVIDYTMECISTANLKISLKVQSQFIHTCTIPAG